MSLVDKQDHFTGLVALLITHARLLGYQVTFGDAYRPKELAELYEQKGLGIKDSLHTDRLAIDLNLFRHGVFLQRTEDYKPIGEFWESLSTKEYECAWGGRFQDGNHFSLAHNGRK